MEFGLGILMIEILFLFECSQLTNSFTKLYEKSNKEI